MFFKIKIDSEVAKLFLHLHPLRKKNIKQALKLLANEPHAGKPLQRELQGYYSYRIARFRLIYHINPSKKIITIIAFGSRASIYDDLQETLMKLKKK
ncbi:type II toxin-antitoxin system RelE/ParE family toxin [bacterium]|nr:type II toxin-antitoxin system RelE/ParE family toxin [bacterium]